MDSILFIIISIFIYEIEYTKYNCFKTMSFARVKKIKGHVKNNKKKKLLFSTGKIIKWVIENEIYEITYERRKS